MELPYNHWFVSRQKRKLTTILPILFAFSDICVGKIWAGNNILQLEFEDELQRRQITSHGSLRSRRSNQGGGGVRTLFKQLKDLGLIFIEEENKCSRLTLIAEALVKGEITFTKAMTIQLQRYQYPSAACWSGNGSVNRTFKVHPFQFLLRLLRCNRLEGYLRCEEIAYIVLQNAKSDSNATFNQVVQLIVDSRRNNNTFDINRANDRKNALYDVSNTFCNYLGLTQFIDRGYKTIYIRAGKEDEVDQFIQTNPPFIPHPELTENYLRAYGRGNARNDIRSFSDDAKTSQEIMQKRIGQEFLLLSLRTPIIEITSKVVQTISEKTGIDEKIIERYLIQNHSHGNLDDFFSNYRSMAMAGQVYAREFELATCEIFKTIFKMRAEHTGPIGNTPDVFVESDEAQYCGIIDNKAYSKGYSLTGNHKRVMKDEYIPNVARYAKAHYKLAFFSYLAGDFGNTIDHNIRELCQQTGIAGSAMPVDIFIDLVQDYAQNGFDHDTIRELFSVNREVKLIDLENQRTAHDCRE